MCLFLDAETKATRKSSTSRALLAAKACILLLPHSLERSQQRHSRSNIFYGLLSFLAVQSFGRGIPPACFKLLGPASRQAFYLGACEACPCRAIIYSQKLIRVSLFLLVENVARSGSCSCPEGPSRAQLCHSRFSHWLVIFNKTMKDRGLLAYTSLSAPQATPKCPCLPSRRTNTSTTR